MPVHWYEGRIIDIKEMSSTTRQFFVSCGEDSFDFLPGQFVTMDLPVGDKRQQRWRSYSIASHPDGSNILEFCIVRSDDGLGTKYLFEDIKLGDTLKFKGPDGGFVIPKNLENEIVMVCTGTGVAPFRSMLSYIRETHLPFHKIHLIFGTRNGSGILYKEEMDEMCRNYPNFKYDVALSREILDGYHHGYVHSIYMDSYQEVSQNRHFYLCGWSQMIDEAVENIILKMGYDKSQVHYELYG